ncbi:tandem-95 repeat protein [Clostridium sp. YIM B02505]|uniref:Tandem-95 repeat protein n=1 Tax=Clostridium yunnanense TaxID=2800325 RepID=A0ABS1EM26_9CLOT|nr:Ig-like domain-containing protein [Clostridium yunnanense]MBK1810420.1 tandem-95 repeat protein [Clostridium yunnanense]
MIRKKAKIIGIIALCLVLYSPVSKVAKATTVITDKTTITNNQSAPWPTKFYPYSKKDGTFISDIYEAYNPGTDLVSSDVLTKGQAGSLPSVYVASDGTNIFFRFRIDASPLAPTAGGFDTSVWQLVIAAEDINNGSSSYGKYVQRVTIGIDGKNPSDDYVYITDGAETNVYKIFKAISNGTAGQQVVPGTRVVKAEGTDPYFLDFQIPISLITDFEKNALGLASPITGNTPVKLYFGTTRAGSISTINKDWMNGTSMNFDDLSTVTLSSISQTLPTINIDGGSSVTATTSTPTISGDTETADGSQIAVTINGHTYNTTVSNKRWSVDVTDPLPNGSYPVTAKVTTSLGNSATANQTLTIAKLNTAPTASNGSLTVIEDTPKIGAMLGNDVDAGTTLSYIIVSGPSHGTVSLGSNGSYTYTPASNYNGTDSFTFKVNDGALDSNVATININTTPVNDKPLANGQSLNINEDTTLNGTVTGSDVDGDSLSYYVVTGPAHGTLTINEDGTFTYKPNKDYNGTDSFTFKSNDGQLDSLPATVNLTVKPINDAPTSNGQTLNTNEDKVLTGTLTGTDIDGDILKYYVVSGTSHGTLNINLDGTFTYTPNKDFNGQDSFTYKVNDGTVDSALATVIINISPVNDAPIAYGQSLNVDEDNVLNDTLTGFDIDGDMLSYYVVTGPTHGILTINEDGTFTYTPNKDYNGQDSFTFKTYDGSEYSTPALVSLTVKPVNDQPIANGKTLSTDEDKILLDILTGTDVDGDGLKYYVVTQPKHGILILNQDGTFTYTPNKDYNGEDSFTFKVNDGSIDSLPATVNLTVDPVNDQPVADGQTLNTDEDTVLAGTLTGSDIDGDSLKYYVATAPKHGTLVINQDGTFTYTPYKDYNGEDSFTFKVNDGNVYSDIATVNLTVNPVNDKPTVLESYKKSTLYNQPVGGTITGNDIDEDILSYYVNENNKPSNGKVSVNEVTGEWTYTPNEGFSGEDTFKVTVDDGKGGTTETIVYINVAPKIFVNTAPTANKDTFSIDEDKSLVGVVKGSDIDEDNLTYYLVTGPTHGTLIFNEDGTFTYTPDKDYNGKDSFTFKVNDGYVYSAPATVNLTVKPVNDAPTSAESYTKTTPYNKAVSGTVVGSDIDNDELNYSVAEINKPVHGIVSINPITGQWTYTPNKGFSGNDSFKVIVSDGNGGTAVSTVYIKVLNADPIVENYSRSTTINKAVSDSVVAIDENEDNLTYSIVSSPSNGTVSLDNSSGRWIYTPKTGFSGLDSFKVEVNDGNGGVAVSNISVNVSATLNLIGNITDQVTGNILVDSTVELRDSSNTLIATVNTNSNGNYYFKNVKLGNYVLVVKNAKYSTQTLALTVATGNTNTDEIRKDANLVNFVINLAANPKVIKGDGVQTTILTAKITDKNNKPLANTTVTFSASMGSFPNGSIVKTDENGIATIVYKSAKIEGTENVSIPVIATVEDKSRGLYTSDKITITFEPGILTGVVVDNTTHLPVKGAVIEISKDFNNDGILDFYSKMITGIDGTYKIAIPKGGITYDIKITKPVVIGGETKLVTFNQKSTVDDIKGDGGEVFTSDKTAAGMVLFKKPNGQDTLLKDYSNLSFDVYDKDNNLVTVGINTHIYNSANDKGVFSADGLEKGEEYKFAVKYTLPNGQKIIIGTMNVSMSQDGEINLSSALIDPYGTITDSITHKIITNVDVKLYYANTARNILAGRKPGTLVELPSVAEFPPADNANPQFSDDFGKYAYMVFPDADYIVVAAKDGYETYTSPIISVGKEIVRHDFSMNSNAKQPAIIAELPKTGSVVDMNGLVMLGTILMLSGMGLTLRPKKN